MSINYTVQIDTTLEIEEFVKRFSMASELDLSEGGVLYNNGVIVRCYAPGELQASVILEAFSFKPKITISFLFDKASEFTSNTSTMFGMLNALRYMVVDHYVLLANDEKIVLEYRDNTLFLNAQWDDWNKDQYSVITHPYSIETINSPLL